MLASPGNLLKMQILGPTADQVNQTLLGLEPSCFHSVLGETEGTATGLHPQSNWGTSLLVCFICEISLNYFVQIKGFAA